MIYHYFMIYHISFKRTQILPDPINITRIMRS